MQTTHKSKKSFLPHSGPVQLIETHHTFYQIGRVQRLVLWERKYKNKMLVANTHEDPLNSNFFRKGRNQKTKWIKFLRIFVGKA